MIKGEKIVFLLFEGIFYMKKKLGIFLLLLALISLLTSCNTTLGMDDVQATFKAVNYSDGEIESSINEASTEPSTDIYTELTTLLYSTSIPSTTYTVRAERVGPSELEYANTTEATTRSQGRTFPTRTQRSGYKTGKEFFDDVVFVGDSVSLGLRNFVNNERNKGNECLGKAQFLVAGSMGYSNTLAAIGAKDSIHPKYQGKEVMIEDGVQLVGAQKIFIMLGLNDFCAYSVDTGMKNAKKLVGRILEKNPDVKIYIQSVTPVIKAKERGKFNNQSIDAFNLALKNLCQANGWTYVDVASCVKGADNCLRNEYCSDIEMQGVHMSYSGYRVWVDFLTNKYC